MGHKPDVTFIICTYNRAAYLDDTLRSLLQDVSPNLNFELLIIDNNSQDNTQAIIQKYQSQNKDDEVIRYFKEPQQGLSYARNRGIKEALATRVVFLDDDIHAGKSLIPAWVSFFSEKPDAVAAGGKIHVQFDDPRPKWMSHFLLPLLGYHDLGNSLKKYPKNKYPFGGNMGFKKSIFEDIGLFDIELGRKGKILNAGEEKELFQRIRSESRDIYYLPDAFLFHRVNADRLTIDYIRQQALGLGQSMRLQLGNASVKQKLFNWISEPGKLFASIPLAAGYILTFNISKAKLLFQFRWWIWKGYFTS
ncbi:MAG TPA: glycosyltransferase [Balneolaceae bacterium]